MQWVHYFRTMQWAKGLNCHVSKEDVYFRTEKWTSWGETEILFSH